MRTAEGHDVTTGLPSSRHDPVSEAGTAGRKLFTNDAAARVGVSPATWRAWRSHGRPRREPVPEPDGWAQLQRPWWWAATVDAWAQRRSAPQDQG